MSPPSKLKQSSIHSFLKPKPKPESESEPEPDYETVRRQTILRNQSFLQTLGIHPLPFKPECKPKSKSKPKPTPKPTTSTPLRRSSRHRPAVDSPIPDVITVDSAVVKYACFDPSILPSSTSPKTCPTFGYEITGKPFRDPSLTKIYALDVNVNAVNQDRFLVAAGGHGGFISVFGVGDEEEEEEEEFRMGLISWKGSRSWISGVGFLERNPMVLVSSSNDGRVVLWDVGKEVVGGGGGFPGVVRDVEGLHSGGIFGMCLKEEVIATASKDGSVGLARVGADGEVVGERNVAGHHEGAVRGICFGDEKDKLADCGADGRICVLDTRLPQPCTLTIESQHSTGINTIEWSNTSKFVLLSASKDPALLLYDIRSPAEPVHAFRNHVVSNSSTCYRIYRPTFVDGGKAIATPGQGSKKLSLYSAEKGTLISQGMIGYDANLVKSIGFGEQETLWVAGKQINQLRRLMNPLMKDNFFG